MDAQMPVMDGIEATQEILEFEKEEEIEHTPIIAVTANVLKGDRERFLGAGMDEYISKPISKDALLKILERVAHGEFNKQHYEVTDNQQQNTQNKQENEKPLKNKANSTILLTTSSFLSNYIKQFKNDIITVENIEDLTKALTEHTDVTIIIDENYDDFNEIKALIKSLKKLSPKKIIVLGDNEIKEADQTVSDLKPETIKNIIKG